jgi:hypothetical protein
MRAEGAGFEPANVFRRLWFSRPVQKARKTLPFPAFLHFRDLATDPDTPPDTPRRAT